MKDLLFAAVEAAAQAGAEVMKQYKKGFTTEIKSDESPVTTADLAANRIIIEKLAQTQIPVYSEEGPYLNAEVVKASEKYWILDPIDGTKDFVNHTDEFVICIGMIGENTALAGVLLAPAMGLLYFGAQGIGSYKFIGDFDELLQQFGYGSFENLCQDSAKLPLQKPTGTYKFLSSRYHQDPVTDEYWEGLKREKPSAEKVVCGSAIKLGLMAEGVAHEYTRFLSVNFWDIAAGHAVAKYAGIKVCQPMTEQEIEYTSETLRVDGYSLKL
ncbi:MAG: 3'(2'),5'-bisphosphate nucleotidase CysQ [Weeksellaceae bacterium]|nr:3'(2'),5'-bisphosphate nucleotidase CysQ [Weeksellaceae bacterium]